tara:strand:- start:283 stop:426 length:144 start_codon:yes stop_codon:yes gene_type:complete
MYKILGRYRGMEWEEIDQCEDSWECDRLLNEYILAFGKGWEFRVKYE